MRQRGAVFFVVLFFCSALSARASESFLSAAESERLGALASGLRSLRGQRAERAGQPASQAAPEGLCAEYDLSKARFEIASVSVSLGRVFEFHDCRRSLAAISDDDPLYVLESTVWTFRTETYSLTFMVSDYRPASADPADRGVPRAHVRIQNASEGFYWRADFEPVELRRLVETGSPYALTGSLDCGGDLQTVGFCRTPVYVKIQRLL